MTFNSRRAMPRTASGAGDVRAAGESPVPLRADPFNGAGGDVAGRDRRPRSPELPADDLRRCWKAMPAEDNERMEAALLAVLDEDEAMDAIQTLMKHAVPAGAFLGAVHRGDWFRQAWANANGCSIEEAERAFETLGDIT
jgi:hypothetical protein